MQRHWSWWIFPNTLSMLLCPLINYRSKFFSWFHSNSLRSRSNGDWWDLITVGILHG
jgi:hypothetical protein